MTDTPAWPISELFSKAKLLMDRQAEYIDIQKQVMAKDAELIAQLQEQVDLQRQIIEVLEQKVALYSAELSSKWIVRPQDN